MVSVTRILLVIYTLHWLSCHLVACCGLCKTSLVCCFWVFLLFDTSSHYQVQTHHHLKTLNTPDSVFHPFSTPAQSNLGSGWSLSHLSLVEKWGTPWAGRQSTQRQNNHARSHSLLGSIYRHRITWQACFWTVGGSRSTRLSISYSNFFFTCDHLQCSRVFFYPFLGTNVDNCCSKFSFILLVWFWDMVKRKLP